MKSISSFLKTTLILFLLCSSSLLAQTNIVFSTQQVLKRLGYYQGAVDGSMGSATSAAIRRFQVANHLRPTGTLTPETSEALGLNTRVSAKKHPRLSSITPQTSPSSSLADPKALADIFVGGPLLAASPEIQVATVQKTQRSLKLLGYYAGPINGFPDANLKAALQTYQKDSKFKRTGRLDKITLMGLNILPGSYQSGS
ncbi:MAG: peptidoglycan-binding protein [Verrucomicrobia bacterium]|nr:peptidoglycan-binding protein [Verrucomicrobiota bacterium]